MAEVSSDSLLKKELTRKEFLGSLLGLVFVILGATNFFNIIRSLHSANTKKIGTTKEASHGFGASKFGA